VTVGGVPLEAFCSDREVEFNDALRQGIDERVRRAAYRIINGKGATYYGIGSALARITSVILADQRSILTVCAPHAEIAGVRDVTLSLPQLVGGDGRLDTFAPALNADETAALRRSAGVIREAIDGLKAEGML